MFVTDEEAAQMYARACRSWYGVRALTVVNLQIERLRAKGDKEGVAAWERVASHLAEQQGVLDRGAGDRAVPDVRRKSR
jgi:hypothetical protein